MIPSVRAFLGRGTRGAAGLVSSPLLLLLLLTVLLLPTSMTPCEP